VGFAVVFTPAFRMLGSAPLRKLVLVLPPSHGRHGKPMVSACWCSGVAETEVCSCNEAWSIEREGESGFGLRNQV
jgi:hypothetical protein